MTTTTHASKNEEQEHTQNLETEIDQGQLIEALAVDPALLKTEHLNFADCWSDIQRMVTRLAEQYVDPSCVNLHHDELVQEGYVKVAKVVNDGLIERVKNREDFFRYLRTAINNHMRGLVQRHRFTYKRTGLRPPPKAASVTSFFTTKVAALLKDAGAPQVPPDIMDQEVRAAILKFERDKVRYVNFVVGETAIHVSVSHYQHAVREFADLQNQQTKPIEISLQDEDAHMQISEPESEDHFDHSSLVERDIKGVLSPIERLVFEQMCHTNEQAYWYAWLDAFRDSSDIEAESLVNGFPASVKLTNSDRARGLGISEELFETVLASVQRKVTRYMDATEQIDKNQAMALLEGLFQIQVPRDLPELDRRRVFTMAAHVQYTKVRDNPPIMQALVTVGAKVPEFRGPDRELLCEGVLYEKGHRLCELCGTRNTCIEKAAQHGLDGTITISPKLLGAKHIRIPTLVGTSESSNDEVVVSAGGIRDDEIRNFLSENFRSMNINRANRKELAFKHRDVPTHECIIFVIIDRGDSALHLRFCSPSAGLISQLFSRRNGHYLPCDMPAAQAIELIKQHAKETFLKNAP